jgi:hypothetical protein
MCWEVSSILRYRLGIHMEELGNTTLPIKDTAVQKSICVSHKYGHFLNVPTPNDAVLQLFLWLRHCRIIPRRMVTLVMND